MYKNRIFKILCYYRFNNKNKIESKIEDDSFSDEILRAILGYNTIASIDISVKQYYMGSYWVISDEMNETKEAENI